MKTISLRKKTGSQHILPLLDLIHVCRFAQSLENNSFPVRSDVDTAVRCTVRYGLHYSFSLPPKLNFKISMALSMGFMREFPWFMPCIRTMKMLQ